MSRTTMIILAVAAVFTLVGATASALAVRAQPTPVTTEGEHVRESETRTAIRPRIAQPASPRQHVDRGATRSGAYARRAERIAREL
jgi:hypothetical protein